MEEEAASSSNPTEETKPEGNFPFSSYRKSILT